MTETEKTKIARIIHALQAKTIENGATEDEAIAAAEKVAELVEKYQIELGSIQIQKEGAVKDTTPITRTKTGVKLHRDFKTKWMMCGAVAEYCGVKVWGNSVADKDHGYISVLGLPSDVEFFMWLIDSLALYEQAQATAYMATNTLVGWGPRWQARKAFTFGCTTRICARLRAAKSVRDTMSQAEKTGRDLVVVKNAVVTEAYAKLFPKGLGNSRSTGMRTIGDGGAFAAGRAAGERAGFGRPIGGGTSKQIGR